jgi:hypothetical protein
MWDIAKNGFGRRTLFLLISAGLLFGGISSSFGRIITVDNDGPADFSSIQGAIDDANDNDTIDVAEGTYCENIRIYGKHNFTLEGAGADVTTIDAGEYGYAVLFGGGSGRISGFTLTNSGNTSWDEAGIHISGGIVIVENNIITNNANGVTIQGNSSVTITANRIINNIINAVEISDSDVTFVGNIIVNSIRGIGGSNSSLLIIGNTITGHSSGITGEGIADSWIVCNNIIADNGKGLSVWGGDSPPALWLISIFNNNLWNNSDADYWMGWCSVCLCIPEDPECVIIGESEPFEPQPGTGEISQDPLFVNSDSGDYHLKSEAGRWDVNMQVWVTDAVTSPCIDAGDPYSN